MEKKHRKFIIYSFAFFSGFANLATEIIGPRLFSSLFGNTTVIWATIISVTLMGISLGYYIGGRIRIHKIQITLMLLLLVNSVWLLLISWVIWELPTVLSSTGFFTVVITALAAFAVPATIFGMASPIAITILTTKSKIDEVGRIVGNVLAISTVGSVIGAITAAFYLIPWVGLSLSLQIFSFISIVYALYFAPLKFIRMALPVALVTLIVPQPSYEWSARAELLEQREGYYQTIRVYSDGDTYVRMHLGPTFESEMNLHTGEPNFRYARTMIELAGDVQNKRVLVIGGAGHAQARELEARGALITEVEIDPFVVKLSDKYFGPIQGEVFAQDGRWFVEQSDPNHFDFVLIDAFNGPASVPPQLTTVEFYQAVNRTLKPDGKLIINFIGKPSGPGSESFKAMAATISKVFTDTRASSIRGSVLQNIIFVASHESLADTNYPLVPIDGLTLTDDLNPIEIFLEEARRESYFRR